MLSSALEHATPEQMFDDPNDNETLDAISAVKALQKAGAQGQRIYHLTQENMGTTLGAIHHDTDTILEIRSALLAGKDVITHTNSVSVPGWSGAGYIILDPDTGVGAYKISGGSNGSYLTGLFLGMFIVMTITVMISTTGGLALPLLAAVLGHAVLIEALITESYGGFDQPCFVSGLWAGLSPVTFLTAPIGGPGFLISILSAAGLIDAVTDLSGARAACFN